MNRRILVSALALAFAAPIAAKAAEPIQPRIVVTGEGEASVRPDLAILTLSVMKDAPTAREALTANSEATTKVIEALKASGIADRDLQTAGIQINPVYTYTNKPDGTQEAKLVGYQVFNTLTIRVREIAKTGEIIDQAVTLGVNQGGSIAFTNDDPSATITEARKKAVADAMAKAKTLTEAAGASIGRIIEISEQNYAQPPMPIEQRAYARDAAAPAPVEAGENSYRVQVNVTFELK